MCATAALSIVATEHHEVLVAHRTPARSRSAGVQFCLEGI